MENPQEKSNSNLKVDMKNQNLDDMTNSTVPGDLIISTEEKQTVSKPFQAIDTEFENILDENIDIEEENYAQMDKGELVSKLNELMIQKDVENAKNKIKKIKDAYLEIKNSENADRLNKFIEDGGLKSDFEDEPSNMENDFFDKIKKLNQRLTDQRKLKEKTLRENYARKQELIDDLKRLIEGGESLNASFEKYQQIQSKWRLAGSVPNNLMHTQWQDFQFHVGRFFDLVKISKELRELDLKKNKELKLGLVLRAEKLIDETSINRSLDLFRQIQQDWQNIGQIEKELNDELWQRIKKVGDLLFEKKEAYLKNLRIKQQENLNKKRVLLENLKVELEIPKKSHLAWTEAEHKIEATMAEWKKIGFGPQKENDQVWQDFRSIRQVFFEKKMVYFEELRKIQIENLKKKINLCEEAEAIQSSEEWDKSATKLKTLQAEWKKIGNVPKKNSDQIWNRFRAACNAFFDSKRLYDESNEEKLKGNILLKEEIISKINSFEPNEDFDQALAILTKLQTDFHEIEIPNADKKRINELYQKAINKVLENFKHEENSGGKYFELKYKLINHTERGQEKITNEKNRIQEKIKTLDSEIALLENNIGFFGKSKGSQKIMEEFQQKISITKTESEQLKKQLKTLKSIQ